MSHVLGSIVTQLANRMAWGNRKNSFERPGHRKGRTASEQRLRRLPDLCPAFCAAAISELPDLPIVRCETPSRRLCSFHG
jgi:hypothetical protein